MGCAVDHGNVGLRDVHEAGLLDKRGHARHLGKRTRPCRQMEHREERVRLTAAEGRLELDDRLAALAGQPLGHLGKQERHAFGDVRAVEEECGILVDVGRLARTDGRDVGGELRLLERAFEHVGVGNRDFTPGFHRSFLQPSKSSRCSSPPVPAARSMPLQPVTISL